MDQGQSKQFSSVGHVSDTSRGRAIRAIHSELIAQLSDVVRGLLVAASVAITDRAVDRETIIFGFEELTGESISIGFTLAIAIQDELIKSIEVDLEINASMGQMTYTGTWYPESEKSKKSLFALRAGTQLRASAAIEILDFTTAYLQSFPASGANGLPTRHRVIYDAKATPTAGDPISIA